MQAQDDYLDTTTSTAMVSINVELYGMFQDISCQPNIPDLRESCQWRGSGWREVLSSYVLAVSQTSVAGSHLHWKVATRDDANGTQTTSLGWDGERGQRKYCRGIMEDIRAKVITGFGKIEETTWSEELQGILLDGELVKTPGLGKCFPCCIQDWRLRLKNKSYSAIHDHICVMASIMKLCASHRVWRFLATCPKFSNQQSP